MNSIYLVGLFIIILIIIWVIIYFKIKKEHFTPGTSNDSEITTWLSDLYKTLNWANAHTDANGSTTVTQEWINLADTLPNSILQYYVNYRRTTQRVLTPEQWVNNPLLLNPVYSWPGLVAAVSIWNQIVELNNNSKDKPLGNIAGFCNESDLTKRRMTLACFLGNATVESAYFLVCKESTLLAKKSEDGSNLCPGTGTDFNPRYFDNCDEADPLTYSCQGGGTGGGGGGGVCKPSFHFTNDGPPSPAEFCQNSGCFPQDPKHTNASLCNVSSDGTTWASYDNTSVKTESDCLKRSDKYKYWCPYHPAPPPITPPAPVKPFDPSTDSCTGGWPTCQFPGSDGKFISLPTSDPCMTDAYADGSNVKIPNTPGRCTDWNGNEWPQAQQCYFGRGLIQLSWSCNYYQAQRSLGIMAKLISDCKKDDNSLLCAFKNAVQLPINDVNSINLCANPDNLCGSYKIDQKTGIVTYNSNIINQCIPWLSCIIYWANKVSPSFTKCYSFETSLEGIAPSGSTVKSDRLSATKFLMTLMGEDINDKSKFFNTDGDLSLTLPGCTADSGGGGGGGDKTIYSVCGPQNAYPTELTTCTNIANYMECGKDNTCPDKQTCYGSVSCPAGQKPKPYVPSGGGGGGSTKYMVCATGGYPSDLNTCSNISNYTECSPTNECPNNGGCYETICPDGQRPKPYGPTVTPTNFVKPIPKPTPVTPVLPPRPSPVTPVFPPRPTPVTPVFPPRPTPVTPVFPPRPSPVTPVFPPRPSPLTPVFPPRPT